MRVAGKKRGCGGITLDNIGLAVMLQEENREGRSRERKNDGGEDRSQGSRRKSQKHPRVGGDEAPGKITERLKKGTAKRQTNSLKKSEPQKEKKEITCSVK